MIVSIISEAQTQLEDIKPVKTKQSYTRLDSRKQVIAFWDSVSTIHTGSSTPTKMKRNKTNKSSTMSKILTEIHDQKHSTGEAGQRMQNVQNKQIDA